MTFSLRGHSKYFSFAPRATFSSRLLTPGCLYHMLPLWRYTMLTTLKGNEHMSADLPELDEDSAAAARKASL